MLVIGDTHIPDRAYRIPEQLKNLIEFQKPWDYVAFVGDLTGHEVLSWVKSLGKRVYIVRGNMDYLPLPRTAVFEVEGLKFGVYHGDGVYPRGDVVKLSKIAQSLDVRVLLTGHTHADFIKLSHDSTRLLVNPGSLTGVWGGEGGSYVPSLIAITAEPHTLVLRVYRLENRLVEKEVVVEVRGSTFNLASI